MAITKPTQVIYFFQQLQIAFYCFLVPNIMPTTVVLNRGAAVSKVSKVREMLLTTPKKYILFNILLFCILYLHEKIQFEISLEKSNENHCLKFRE